MATNLLDVILNDHANFRRVLDVLDEQIGKIEAMESVDYDLLLSVAEYLLDYPDRYHHPVEDLIVDALVRHNTAASRPAVLYRAEHDDIHDRAAEFSRMVSDVAADEPTRRAAFVEAGRQLSGALRDHLAREERHFIPLARRYLDDAELAEIAGAMPPLDDPIFGSARRDHYKALLAAITAFEAGPVPA